jgi:glutathione S-transferase
MIRFYFHHTPNPMKAALFLEETGFPYEVSPVATSSAKTASSPMPRSIPTTRTGPIRAISCPS